MATGDQTRNKLRFTGLVAGLSVWAALSGVGSLSALAGLFLALLTCWMLTGLLVWAVCKGDTGGGAQAPVNEGEGLPGWLLLVAVLALLVWIGLSGVGDMSGSAGFVFALLAMVGLTGLVIWARGGGGAADAGDHRFAMLPERDEDNAPAVAPALTTTTAPAEAAIEAAAPAIEAAATATAGIASDAAATATAEVATATTAAPPAGPGAQAVATGAASQAQAETGAAPQAQYGGTPVPPAALPADTAAAPDDLKLIKGIGPALEKALHEAGVTRLAQIAAWDQAGIDGMAARLGRMGGRIRADDWVGQAQALLARSPAGDEG